MKKILFILPSLGVGGLERVQVTIANALADKGYDVTIMTFDDGDELVAELDKRVRFIHKPPKPFPIRRRMKYIWKFYDSGKWETRASAAKLYKYYVGDERYDVEIAFFRGRAVKIISGSTNRSSVKLAWVHNDYKLCGGVTANFKSLDGTKNAYGKFDKIVSVSDQAGDSFKEVIGRTEGVTTVYNMLPVDEIIRKSHEPCEIKKDKFTVVSVGRLNMQKGFDRLLEAADKLNRMKLEFDLYIVGGGEEKEKLERYISEHELKNVFLLGEQMNPYKYVSRADLAVCSSRFEGYNLTVAEALILGKPVLSTKCTGPCEILDNGKYGYICENSVQGLADGMSRFITDRTLLEKYQNGAEERKQFFDNDKICERIEQLFNE